MICAFIAYLPNAYSMPGTAQVLRIHYNIAKQTKMKFPLLGHGTRGSSGYFSHLQREK